MALNVRFAFVCQKSWQELTGTDPVRRFCGDCQRDIVNLDALSAAEREALFRDAIRTGTKPCVFATVPIAHGTPCESPSVAELMSLGVDEQMIGGEMILDDDVLGLEIE
jgi:hypothetical protein